MTRGREMEIQFASQLIAYIPACTKISLCMLKDIWCTKISSIHSQISWVSNLLHV
jgi:hypothetical protein